MSERHEDFYKMIKDWVIRDFRTPDIKAEVIVNMLISDFIEELIQYHYGNDIDVKLLMKEFPMKITSEEEPTAKPDGNRNAKVDYLVGVGNEKLVLVELKTSNGSFDYKQKQRMQEIVNDNEPQKVLESYRNVIYPFYMDSEGSESYKRKYKYRHKQYENTLSEEDEKRYKEIDYLYIFLKDNERQLGEKKLILEDYCKNDKDDKKYEGFCKKLQDKCGAERRRLWEEISDILLECAKDLDENGEVKE